MKLPPSPKRDAPLSAALPFSKFDPDRPVETAHRGTTPAAGRRAWILKWGLWIYTAMLVLGYVLIAYWLTAGK